MKTLVITGGSRGIGLETAICFQREGWKIINISRTVSHLDKVVNIQCDLSMPLSAPVKKVLNKYVKKSSQICLVLNASHFFNDKVFDLDLEKLNCMFHLNIISGVELQKSLIPSMKPGDSIIHIGSTLSEVGIPDACSYAIVKHALLGLMRSACQDLMSKKIHTCCLCPGLTDTKMLQDRIHDQAELKEKFEKINGFGRFIKPNEIAEAIWFCANNPVVNGSVIHANLGQNSRG